MVLPILVGLLVYFILVVFEPFGTHLSTTPNKSIRLLGIGLIAGGMVFISDSVIPKRFPNFYNVYNWTIGKAVIHTIIVLMIIAIIIAIYIEIAFPNDPAAPDFLRCILYTYIIGVIPSIVITGYKYIKFLELQNEQSIENAQQSSVKARSIRLSGTSNGSEFVIDTSEIILCSAMGNYVLVFYEKADGIDKQLIRKTISSIEEDLIGENFIRCHRSHIVNMEKVISKEGNAKGMKLTMGGVKTKIQVSRRSVPLIQSWIAQSPKLGK